MYKGDKDIWWGVRWMRAINKTKNETGKSCKLPSKDKINPADKDSLIKVEKEIKDFVLCVSTRNWRVKESDRH